MRRISFAQFTASSLLFALFFIALAASAARRPRYGGRLTIELQGRVTSLDAAKKQRSVADQIAQERLLRLIADRLIDLDQFGQPKSDLAVSWQHNEKFTRWEFHLRQNVNFQDATPLTPQAIADFLQAAHSNWRVTGASDSVIIESDSPSPKMLYVLAETRDSVLLHKPEGQILGTGPFRLATWESGKHAVFAANDDYWGGRPFVDSIDVQMGSTIRERMIDLDLDKADIADIAPDRARIDVSRGVRISASDPTELLALVFTRSSVRATDIRIRHALSLAIDRGSLVDFVLQREGEPAGAVLPQWSSGYAFLFSTTADVATARQLASQISPARALKLGYDAADPTERMLAERIAVNAQAAGILISMRPIPVDSAAGATSHTADHHLNVPEFDARLMLLRMPSPAPGAALEDLLQTLVPLADLDSSLAVPLDDPANPEQLYSRERAVTDTYEIIPLLHVPEVVGLSARVRNWMPARWGAWRLADVWLDGAAQ
ncbi:MAG TPA: ABC transporter substrate-binding protein [Candidatus Acidoferrales bacterium]|nr:ABC transporter substrate-binding protein [Candidatus Acidoferrales bacterium]